MSLLYQGKFAGPGDLIQVSLANETLTTKLRQSSLIFGCFSHRVPVVVICVFVDRWWRRTARQDEVGARMQQEKGLVY